MPVLRHDVTQAAELHALPPAPNAEPRFGVDSRDVRLGDTESDITDPLDTIIPFPNTIYGAPIQPNHSNLTASCNHLVAEQAVESAQGTIVNRDQMVDAYLTEQAYWRDTTSEVRESGLGRYRVLNVWFSYRGRNVLERGLEVSWLARFSGVARRTAALLTLGDSTSPNGKEAAAVETVCLS